MGPAVSHFVYILTEHQRCHWTHARKLLNHAHESTVYLACPKRPPRFKHFTFLPSNNKNTNNIITSPRYTSTRHKPTHLHTNSTPRSYSVAHRFDPISRKFHVLTTGYTLLIGVQQEWRYHLFLSLSLSERSSEAGVRFEVRMPFYFFWQHSMDVGRGDCCVE